MAKTLAPSEPLLRHALLDRRLVTQKRPAAVEAVCQTQMKGTLRRGLNGQKLFAVNRVGH